MARSKEIEIDTRLGRRCIDTDKVVHFPRGLAGFENERDFILVGDAEKQLLHIESLEQAAVLVTVSIPAGAPEQAALNLTGPIVINYEARVGLQVPQCGEGLQQVNLHSLKPVEEAQDAETTPADGAQGCCCAKAAPTE